ncbi:unnamed protein product [Sphagnum compactum]
MGTRSSCVCYRLGAGAIVVLALFAAAAQARATAHSEFFGEEKDWTLWSAVVTGGVFCDQCLQDKVFPFSEPMDGAKVTVACKDNNGNVVDSVQGSTDFLGNFLVTFKGKQDLSGCTVSLAGSPRSDCNIAGGGAKTLTLKSRLLFEALYVVDPLFYQPAKPLDFCPKNSSPTPSTPSGSITVPFPNRHPSTCSPSDWLNIEYYCWWPKALSPLHTTVGSVFGKGAEKKYGNKSLVGGLLTGDELLRQSIAALLNSQTNMHFYMSSRGVTRDFNNALLGSAANAATIANQLAAANSGYGRGRCLLVPCKL